MRWVFLMECRSSAIRDVVMRLSLSGSEALVRSTTVECEMVNIPVIAQMNLRNVYSQAKRKYVGGLFWEILFSTLFFEQSILGII